MKDSEFYCAKKHCRKTAWDTPEYMTDDDWGLVDGLLGVIDGNPALAYELLWMDLPLARAFFNHTLGWPEGYEYCQDRGYFNRCFIFGFERHQQVKLRDAFELFSGRCPKPVTG